MKNDNRIKELNFNITISFESMDIDTKDRIPNFVDFVVNHIDSIKNLSDTEILLSYEASEARFNFNRPTKDTKSRDFASIQFSKNNNEQGLQVGFIHGIVPYNQSAIRRNLCKAYEQIEATQPEYKGSLTSIGLWSQRYNFNLLNLMFNDMFKEDNEISERYYILDSFFEEEQDLDAIIFFKKESRLTTSGLVITNPYKPSLEKQFEETLAPLGEQYRVVLGIKK